MSNEYEGFDTAAAAADIGAELFGGETAVEEVAEPVADTPAADSPAKTEPALSSASAPAENQPQPLPDPSAPAVVPGLNSEAAGLPKSWRKEMAPEWEKASPGLKAYVQERESQMMRGINQYAGSASQWNTLVQPFAPLLQQYPEVNPVELMQGLTATHLHLLSPSVSQADKVRVVQGLLQEYGISLSPEQAPSQDNILARQVQELQQQLRSVSQKTESFERNRYQSEIAGQLKAVETFAADPKNKFFNEVGDHILHLVKTGAASDLQNAYDIAIWSNPTVRAKLLAEQQVTAQPSTEKPRAKNGQFINLDADAGKPVSRPISIDNTIDEVVAKHYSKQAH